MSRFDYKDPGTDPAYCDGLTDTATIRCHLCGDTVLIHADDEDTNICDRCIASNPTFPPDPPVDPSEHAMHALIDALTTLEQQIVLADKAPFSSNPQSPLERLNALRKLTKRAEQHATLVHNKCADAIDRAMERIR
jgi:hypothetical protein